MNRIEINLTLLWAYLTTLFFDILVYSVSKKASWYALRKESLNAYFHLKSVYKVCHAVQEMRKLTMNEADDVARILIQDREELIKILEAGKKLKQATI